ncbi:MULTISPECIES: LytR/AlgR family response regulator transcription factor [Myroides]|uniref:Response regulator n=1 Tax=Myroides albus TaxID=2562892 RepID=A0A6I3LLC9_9FLAO|nr:MULTISPECIES: LytTR family DNA-binding domain-containing protein [Myroides]MTG98316.1 response regulator [Myroides albus]MVX36583.1 response regulator [Myroides sp. LoEW2-1]UVD79611.1 LytTR family DNA-binding domain-containing protein [Myroides albus]
MTGINIVIIEDEKPAARSLERKLEKLGYFPNAKLTNVEEAIEWFGSNKEPDLIFLDIQLSDGLSFEIFEQVKVNSAIIFTTAYDEYALRAFKLNSIDYLLKPIQADELEQAIQKFKNNKQAIFGFNEQLSMFTQFLSNNVIEYKERFVVKIGMQIKIISTTDIMCFFSENKATYIKTNEGRNYLTDYSLEEIEKHLSPNDFFRINRKFIISLVSIHEIHAFSNSRLKVNLKNFDDDDLIVSREKVNDFKKWIEK